VEDEAVLRLGAVDMLQDEGFTVLEAGDADEAIAILEQRSDIRLVFTDVTMPGSMDGLKLAAAVRNRWPPVEIIVTSGRSLPDSELLPERSVFIAKPYQPEQVLRAVGSFDGLRQPV
jgi:two-component system, response regulator PdtaR